MHKTFDVPSELSENATRRQQQNGSLLLLARAMSRVVLLLIKIYFYSCIHWLFSYVRQYHWLVHFWVEEKENWIHFFHLPFCFFAFPSTDDFRRQIIACKTSYCRLLCNIHSGSIGNPAASWKKSIQWFCDFFSVLFEEINYFSLLLTSHVAHVPYGAQYTNPMDYFCPSGKFSIRSACRRYF